MEPFVDVPEAANYCHVSEHTIRRWIGCGILKATRPGRAFLIKREDLDELLNRPARGMERWVQAIVRGAPELTPDQVARLRDVLGRSSE